MAGLGFEPRRPGSLASVLLKHPGFICSVGWGGAQQGLSDCGMNSHMPPPSFHFSHSHPGSFCHVGRGGQGSREPQAAFGGRHVSLLGWLLACWGVEAGAKPWGKGHLRWGWGRGMEEGVT